MHKQQHFIIGVLLLTTLVARAQSLPVGTPLLEETYRRTQLQGGRDSFTSFMIRPLVAAYANAYDSLYNPGNIFSRTGWADTTTVNEKRGFIRMLPVSLQQQWNTHHPYGWNDGPMIQAKGYQNKLSAGVYARIGILSVQLQPEFVMAQNSSFQTFPEEHTDSTWYYYYNYLNTIDNPEKYGHGTYYRLFPGQSSIRLNYKKVSLGLSTENLWWGPGSRNSLLMSNNAPGFPHLSFNSRAPVKTAIGHFEWQLISGRLTGSGILPPDTGRLLNGQHLYIPKKDDDRYLNAMVITWQPKWVRGLFLGFSRSFYQYQDEVPHTLNGYLPVLTSFFKDNSVDESETGRDQMLSFYLRWVLAREQAEIYAEYGRNDHSQNVEDFFLEPEHSRAFLFGFKKLFNTGKDRNVELMIEFANLQAPSTGLVRDIPNWYQHHQVRHGYTQRGQVMGAGIGPGSNSQTIGFNWIRGIRKFGLFAERIAINNDFYYKAFTSMKNYQSHWVDLSLNALKAWNYRRFIFNAELSFIHSLNYQWRYEANPATLLDGKKNANNLHMIFGISYIL